MLLSGLYPSLRRTSLGASLPAEHPGWFLDFNDVRLNIIMYLSKYFNIPTLPAKIANLLVYGCRKHVIFQKARSPYQLWYWPQNLTQAASLNVIMHQCAIKKHIYRS